MAFSDKYIKLFVVLLTVGYIAGQNTCLNLVTNGYTVPHGDIVLHYGEALNITCNLHKKIIDDYGANASSRLFFKRNSGPIPGEMMEVINSTSIRLQIEKHPKTIGDNYYCYFHANEEEQLICMNVVIVAVAPQNITDFSCISRNYENLTCTWTPPQNYIKTDYNLTYYLNSRPSRFSYNCTGLKKLENGQMQCFWNVSTNPQYRPVHECYYFSIGMNNTFGTNLNTYVFEHFKRVLPNPPENLTAVATSPHSIHLSWVIPFSMASFKPGLHHRILYQCEYYEKVWQFGGLITNVKNKTLSYELKGLKYAHALCDIRVGMISSKADKTDESMWSDNATRTVRTESKIPDCPPKTNVGSFEVVNNRLNRDAYVYFQDLDETQKNGQNFSYIIEVQNHPSMHPVELTKIYAFFKNLSVADYTFNIWSVNEKGRSAEKSILTIPANRFGEPLNFIRVAHRQDLFELSWEPPKGTELMVVNYTIFWCRNERDRPYQCMGNLNWTVVSNNIRKYNQTLMKNGIYQFAISANTWNSSSGMSWAECTIIPNRSMGKIKTVSIPRVGSDFIDVEWKLDCSNRIDTIQGFIIFYCPIESPLQKACKKTTEKNVTIPGDVNVQSGTVKGLKPYTSYRLTVGYILSHSTYSQTSEPMHNTTNEAAPATPPLNVDVFNVTNSSISLKWQPPTQMNGWLRYYYVYYNDKKVKIEKDEINEITLTNLMSFENYSISIEACTVRCSHRSEPINVTTKMWLPGEINQPIIISEKDSQLVIVWDRPNPPRGKVNYYQIKVTHQRDSEEPDGPFINVTTQNFTIDSCASRKNKTLFVSVRAVNIIHGDHKAGNWSAVLESSCNPYTPVVYILVGSLVIFFIITVTCAFKKVYEWWTGLEPIVPKLPPGLEADVEIWDSGKPKDPLPDAELLLQNIGGTRISGDSSGCSSGHESITSSLESTAQISPSDSGTEQPRSPSLNGENRKNSLRQRNVSTPRPTINIGYVTADTIVPPANWVPKHSATAAGNYCVLGLDSSNMVIHPDPPYIPVTDINTKLPLNFSCDLSQSPPPSYVKTGDLLQTQNPGYVPYSTAEPSDKNIGYVVAGLPKDLLGSELIHCDVAKPTVIEEKPHYMRATESIPIMKPQFPWQQPLSQPTLLKSGYVSVGDVPSPKSLTEVTKGYVPHRQFEAKSLKED